MFELVNCKEILVSCVAVEVCVCLIKRGNRKRKMEEERLNISRRSRRMQIVAGGDMDDRGWTLLHVVARKGDLKEVLVSFMHFHYGLTVRQLLEYVRYAASLIM